MTETNSIPRDNLGENQGNVKAQALKTFFLDNGVIILLVFLFFSAFVLSFDSLNDLAFTYGIVGYFLWIPLSALWPLSMDVMIVASSLVAYNGAKQGYGNKFVRSAGRLVLFFTAMSIFFNIVEAFSTQSESLFGLMASTSLASNAHIAEILSNLVGSVLVRVIPPIGMYISFEKLLMKSVHHQMQKAGVVRTIAQLEADAVAATAVITVETDKLLDERKAALRTLAIETDTVENEYATLQASIEKAQATLAGLETNVVSKRAELRAMGGKKKSVKVKQPTAREVQAQARRAVVQRLWESGVRTKAQLAAGAKSTTRTITDDLIALGLVKDDDEIKHDVGVDGMVVGAWTSDVSKSKNGHGDGTQN